MRRHAPFAPLIALLQQRRPAAIGDRDTALDPHRAVVDAIEHRAPRALADDHFHRLVFFGLCAGHEDHF